jgi:hypothetical protein
MPFYNDTSRGMLLNYSQWWYHTSGVQLDLIQLDLTKPQPSS